MFRLAAINIQHSPKQSELISFKTNLIKINLGTRMAVWDTFTNLGRTLMAATSRGEEIVRYIVSPLEVVIEVMEEFVVIKK